MNQNCSVSTIICRNVRCGYAFADKTNGFMCKLCKITERNRQTTFNEEVANQQVNPSLNASITFDPRSNTLTGKDEFYSAVEKTDWEQKELFEKHFLETERILSMSFDIARNNTQVSPPDEYPI